MYRLKWFILFCALAGCSKPTAEQLTAKRKAQAVEQILRQELARIDGAIAFQEGTIQASLDARKRLTSLTDEQAEAMGTEQLADHIKHVLKSHERITQEIDNAKKEIERLKDRRADLLLQAGACQ